MIFGLALLFIVIGRGDGSSSNSTWVNNSLKNLTEIHRVVVRDASGASVNEAVGAIHDDDFSVLVDDLDKFDGFNSAFDHRHRSKRAPIYQNEFAVYIPSGDSMADEIASKNGFTNMGQVSVLFKFFFIIKLSWTMCGIVTR